MEKLEFVDVLFSDHTFDINIKTCFHVDIESVPMYMNSLDGNITLRCKMKNSGIVMVSDEHSSYSKARFDELRTEDDIYDDILIVLM